MYNWPFIRLVRRRRWGRYDEPATAGTLSNAYGIAFRLPDSRLHVLYPQRHKHADDHTVCAPSYAAPVENHKRSR